MLAFFNPPVDEVFPELIEGTAEVREQRDVQRKEYAVAAKKNAAQYRLALRKKQFIAELIVRGVLEEHNGSKFRAMQAKNKVYHPQLSVRTGNQRPALSSPTAMTGSRCSKLLEYLDGPGDSQDIDEHMLYL